LNNTATEMDGLRGASNWPATTPMNRDPQPRYRLGLSIAHNIARAHGGKLTLLNHLQGGLEAVLEFTR
jgi:K+-sensing histidine kinase KdpD